VVDGRWADPTSAQLFGLVEAPASGGRGNARQVRPRPGNAGP